MKNTMGYLIMLLHLSSCGELSYKRGAGPTTLESDKKICISQSSANLENCLASKGWTSKNLSELSFFEELQLQNPSSINLDKIEVSDGKLVPQTAGTENRHSSKNVDIENAINVDKPQLAVQQASNVASKPISTAKLETVEHIPKLVSPTHIYTVSSWWKLGTKSDAFYLDASECNAKLGASHSPNHAQQKYTAGFLVCMRDKKWKALVKQN